jgi:glycosyltransferase involved in cell wall biosynthesis
MKILFHLNDMGRGGAQRVVGILSNAFAGKGHQVIIATQWYAENEYKIDAKVQRVSVGLNEADKNKGRLSKAFIRYLRLRKCIIQNKPDIVISFCSKANFRSSFAMIGLRIPLLVSVRNDPMVDYAPYKLPTWYMERKAAGCVFQTPDAMKYFNRNLQNKGRVILNPISEQYIKLNWDINTNIERKKEIVTVGRITSQKNHLLLFEAFNEISLKYPEYTLKLYGEIQDKDVYEKLKQYISDNKLEDRIMFMGLKSNPGDYIKDVSMFVLSSDYEGMPNALMEAMVLGVPSISTDCPCGGPRMVIENWKNGILVPVGDKNALAEAMEYIITHEREADIMGEEAKKLIEQVEPDKICGQWMEYILELVN